MVINIDALNPNWPRTETLDGLDTDELLENQAPPGPPPREGLRWKPQTHRWIRPKEAKKVSGPRIPKMPPSTSYGFDNPEINKTFKFLKHKETYNEEVKDISSPVHSDFLDVHDWLHEGGRLNDEYDVDKPKLVRFAKGSSLERSSLEIDSSESSIGKPAYINTFSNFIYSSLVGARYPNNDNIRIPKRHVRKIINISLNDDTKSSVGFSRAVSLGGRTGTLAGRMTKPAPRYKEGTLREEPVYRDGVLVDSTTTGELEGKPVSGGHMEIFNVEHNIAYEPLRFAQTVMHEMAHGVYFDLPVWAKIRLEHHYVKAVKAGKGFPSQYAKESRDEFFSECYVAYVTNTRAFRQRNPAMADELDIIFTKTLKERSQKFIDRINDLPEGPERGARSVGLTLEEWEMHHFNKANQPTDEEIAKPIEEEDTGSGYTLVEKRIDEKDLDLDSPDVIEDPAGVIGFTEELPDIEPYDMPLLPEESFEEDLETIENQRFSRVGPPGSPPRVGLKWKEETHRWVKEEVPVEKPEKRQGMLVEGEGDSNNWDQSHIKEKIEDYTKDIQTFSDRVGDLLDDEGLSFTFNDIREMYSLPESMPYKIALNQLILSEKSLILSLRVKDADGHEVGNMRRRFNLDENGLFVHHDNFFIDTDHQGKGIASSLNEQLDKAYKRMGVDSVRLHADGDVGKYAWAVQGFDFDPDSYEGPQSWRTAFNERIELLLKAKDPATVDLSTPKNPKHEEIPKLTFDVNWGDSSPGASRDAQIDNLMPRLVVPIGLAYSEDAFDWFEEASTVGIPEGKTEESLIWHQLFPRNRLEFDSESRLRAALDRVNPRGSSDDENSAYVDWIQPYERAKAEGTMNQARYSQNWKYVPFTEDENTTLTEAQISDGPDRYKETYTVHAWEFNGTVKGKDGKEYTPRILMHEDRKRREGPPKFYLDTYGTPVEGKLISNNEEDGDYDSYDQFLRFSGIPRIQGLHLSSLGAAFDDNQSRIWIKRFNREVKASTGTASEETLEKINNLQMQVDDFERPWEFAQFNPFNEEDGKHFGKKVLTDQDVDPELGYDYGKDFDHLDKIRTYEAVKYLQDSNEPSYEVAQIYWDAKKKQRVRKDESEPEFTAKQSHPDGKVKEDHINEVGENNDDLGYLTDPEFEKIVLLDIREHMNNPPMSDRLLDELIDRHFSQHDDLLEKQVATAERTSTTSSAPSSGPPRPGLVWKPTTHRWIRPGNKSSETGAPKGRAGEQWYKPDQEGDERPVLTVDSQAIPPAWKDLWVNHNTDADRLATGFDEAGRTQTLYSKEYGKKSKAVKFDRVRSFAKGRKKLVGQIKQDIDNGNEEAIITSLINLTFMRPGSDVDTKAKQKAYGATTLLTDHVKVKGDVIHFDFPSKKGGQSKRAIKDKQLAKIISDRKSKLQTGERLFNTDAKKVNDYINATSSSIGLPGAGTLKYTSKDFRTLGATVTATEELKTGKYTMKPPMTAEQVQKLVDRQDKKRTVPPAIPDKKKKVKGKLETNAQFKERVNKAKEKRSKWKQRPKLEGDALTSFILEEYDKDLAKAKMPIGEVVSDLLQNTPTEAVRSYIDPHVFEEWNAIYEDTSDRVLKQLVGK